MRIVWKGLLLLLGASVMAGVLPQRPAGGQPEEGSGFDLTHQLFDQLLSRHVRDGLVDYRGLEKERPQLQEYLASLGHLDRASFKGFTEAQQLALLINAYNAYTLELILRHTPVSSIQEIPGAWDRLLWPLLGEEVSLNQIEHELIRKNYDEPRIHLALVCAALGCPPLATQAYRGEALEEQLAAAARNFLRDPARNRLDRETGTLYLSKVFEWYGNDFIPSWGAGEGGPADEEDNPKDRALIRFSIEYMGEPAAEFLRSNRVTIEYLDYDWRLNGRESE